MRTVLFIGGPYDGERKAVDNGLEHVLFPVMVEPPYTQDFNIHSPVDAKMEMYEYTILELAPRTNVQLWIAVPKESPDLRIVLARLVEHYHPPLSGDRR